MGRMMCEGRSAASWTMYSPRSVSTTATPAASSASLRWVSSVTMDLDFTTRRRPAARAIPQTMRFASAPVLRPVDDDAVRLQLALEAFEMAREIAQHLQLGRAGRVAHAVRVHQRRERRVPARGELRRRAAEGELELRVVQRGPRPLP